MDLITPRQVTCLMQLLRSHGVHLSRASAKFKRLARLRPSWRGSVMRWLKTRTQKQAGALIARLRRKR